MDSLVTAAWLAGELGAADLVVLDATSYLPNEGKHGHDTYLEGHIPGARWFDLDAASDPASRLPHTLPTAAHFAGVMAALGVGDGMRVVAYDATATMWATRLWWMLRTFGHDAVAVLDGGLTAWRAAGYPIETGVATPARPATFTPRLRLGRVRMLGDMIDRGDALVVDARAAPRFHGAVPEPRPGLEAGHIPGAVNLPYGELLAEDKTFLPTEALRARLIRAGVDGARPVITSCGSGVSATVLTFAMHRAGLPEGAVYDGSWSEWGADPALPKER